MQRIQVYLKYNMKAEYLVKTEDQAREHAKRIITEGFVWDWGLGLAWYPVHSVIKVRTPDIKGEVLNYES